MKTKLDLDRLNQNSVSVKTQKYIIEDGQELLVGQPHRKAFVNSERGRQELQQEIAEPYRSAVLAVWGNQPTVEEH